MSLIEKLLGKKIVEEARREKEKSEEELKNIEKEPRVSILWYFLPFLFGFLGGLIGWALLRNQNRKHAVNLLAIGIFMTIFLILVEVLR